MGKNYRKKLSDIFILLIAIIIGVNIHSIIHELGHVIVVVLLGGQIKSVQPFFFLGLPGVEWTSNFDNSAKAFVDISGMISQIILGYSLLLFRFKHFNTKILIFLSVFISMLFCQIILWTVIPLLYIFNIKSRHDITDFILHSGIHPIFIIISNLLILAIGIFLFIKFSKFFNLNEALSNLKKPTKS